AVAGVLGRRLFVLTGGPGTGKTTTVLRMLMMLQRSADRPLRVRACAPTGKAAQRLLQSLRDGRAALLQGGPGQPPLPQDWHAARECCSGGEALTLHRLRALRTRTGVFGHHARQRVAADVVVVDEASMVDLSMMHALFDAVAPEALLLLVGDSDQLASVAAGSALMDIVSVLEGEQAPELVRLEHSFRA